MNHAERKTDQGDAKKSNQTAAEENPDHFKTRAFPDQQKC